MKNGIKRMFTKSLIILVMFAAFAPLNASPTTVPPDLRITNLSNLVGYDAVEQIGLNSMPRGMTVFEDETTIVPSGWRIWFLDDGTKPYGWDEGTPFIAGLQPMGVVDTSGSGLYNFVVGRAIQGDEPGTHNLDEGATVGTFLTLVGQNLSDNSFFEATWISGTMMTNGFQQVINERHDIMIDRNSPIATIPEPATLLLVGIGTGVVGWLKRRKQLR